MQIEAYLVACRVVAFAVEEAEVHHCKHQAHRGTMQHSRSWHGSCDVDERTYVLWVSHSRRHSPLPPFACERRSRSASMRSLSSFHATYSRRSAPVIESSSAALSCVLPPCGFLYRMHTHAILVYKPGSCVYYFRANLSFLTHRVLDVRKVTSAIVHAVAYRSCAQLFRKWALTAIIMQEAWWRHIGRILKDYYTHSMWLNSKT